MFKWIVRSSNASHMFDKNITFTHIVFRIQSDDSIICRYYFIALIEYMIAGKSLLDSINLSSSNYYELNVVIIYRYNKKKVWIRKIVYNYILDWKRLINIMKDKVMKEGCRSATSFKTRLLHRSFL